AGHRPAHVAQPDKADAGQAFHCAHLKRASSRWSARWSASRVPCPGRPAARAPRSGRDVMLGYAGMGQFDGGGGVLFGRRAGYFYIGDMTDPGDGHLAADASLVARHATPPAKQVRTVLVRKLAQAEGSG